MKQIDEQEDYDNDIPNLEELPSLLKRKDESTIFVKELLDVNIGTSDQEILIKVRDALLIP